MIKQDLAKLNMDIADLQQQVKSRSHHETKHMRTHSSSVVVSLQVSSLKSFSCDVTIIFENMKKIATMLVYKELIVCMVSFANGKRHWEMRTAIVL